MTQQTVNYTLIDSTGAHQYYLTGTPPTGYTIRYYTHKAEPATFFNGRLHLDYTVTATPQKNGKYTYTLPRRAPVYFLFSPNLCGNTEKIKVLDLFTCPVEAIHSNSTYFAALPNTFTIGSAQSPTRQQFASIIERNKPEQIIIHLSPTNAPDYDTLKQAAELCTEIARWFYKQVKKNITPKSKNHTPKIFIDTNGLSVEITELTDNGILELFNIKDVTQYFEKYYEQLPQPEIWYFGNKPYKTIDGEPEPQNESLTEKVIQILLDVYKLRINLVTDDCEVWSRSDNQYIPLDEKMTRSLKIRLNEEFGLKLSLATLQEIIFANWAELLHNKRYTRPTFHPFTDYFYSLKHDGKDHIKQLFNALILDSVEVSTATLSPDTITELKKILPDGSIKNGFVYWQKASYHYFKKWIIGIALQALTKNKCNAIMPIFTGATNRGKSTYLKYLLPPELSPYYIAGGVYPSVTNYETAVLLRSALLINFDDEPDSWAAHQWKNLKSMITIDRITYRAKYDKAPATYQRVCSFASTSNYPDLLNDPTGTRRFLILPVTDIQRFFWQQIDIDQVWAQVIKEAFTDNIPIELNKPELELLLQANSMFYEDNIEQQLLVQYLTPINETEAQAESGKPDYYQAAHTLTDIGTNIVLMRELDILAYLTQRAEAGTKITTKGLRDALQKEAFKETHCYRQRTFNGNRNIKCFAVKAPQNKLPQLPTPGSAQTETEDTPY